jgi:hypothetical protein
LQSAAKVTNIILEIHGTIFLIINFGRYSNWDQWLCRRKTAGLQTSDNGWNSYYNWGVCMLNGNGLLSWVIQGL